MDNFYHLFSKNRALQVILTLVIILGSHAKSLASIPAHPNYFLDKDVKDSQLFKIQLNKIRDTESFQLISHGRPGELYLNGEWKNAKEIAIWLSAFGFQHSAGNVNRISSMVILNNIQHSASNIKHLNIYGCEFAKGEKGLAAVKYLEKNLGITVSASTNLTGVGGDWKLEVGQPVATLNVPTYKANLQTCTPPINLPASILPQNRGFGTYTTAGLGPTNVAVNINGQVLTTQFTALNGSATYNGTAITNTANLLNNDLTLSGHASSGATLSRSSIALPNGNFVYLECYPWSNTIPKLVNAATGAVTNFSTTLPATYYDYVKVYGNHVYFVSNTGSPNLIRRTDLNGVLDTGFTYNYGTGLNGDHWIFDVAEAADGHVYVYQRYFGLIRRNSDGSSDATWPINSIVTTGATSGSIANNAGKQMVIQSTGKIVLYGTFILTSGGNTYNGLVRFNTDGSIDNTFTPQHFESFSQNALVDCGGSYNQMILDSQDNIYLFGKFERVQGQAIQYLTKLTANGAIDPVFRSNTYSGGMSDRDGTLQDIAIGPDDKLVAVSYALDGITSLDYNGIVRLLPNGKPDVPINNSADNLSASCASSATATAINYAACTGTTSNLNIMYMPTQHGTSNPVVQYNLAIPQVSQVGFVGKTIDYNQARWFATPGGIFDVSGNYTYWLYFSQGSWGVNPWLDKVDNTTGQIVWTYKYTASNTGFLQDIRVSPDGSMVAISFLAGVTQIINTATGALMTTGVPVLPSGGVESIDWAPDGKYLYYINASNLYAAPVNGGASVLVSNNAGPAQGHQTIRFAQGNSNILYAYHWTGNGLQPTISRLTNNEAALTASLNTSWATNGTYNFIQGNVIGDYNQMGVDGAGNVYLIGEQGSTNQSSTSATVKNNVVKLSADGTTINYSFIPTSEAASDNHYRLTFGGGAACPCAAGTTAPGITPTSATNTCPSKTVNLGTLANTGTLPSGSTLVWSTHSTPTSNADTLTNLNVSTAGTYYALYHSATGACFSPSDSVTVTITACPNLATVKTASVTTSLAGTPYSYTLTTYNTGPDPSTGTITVKDTLATGLAYNSASGTGWTCSTSTSSAGNTIVTCTSTTVLAATTGVSSPITISVTPNATAAASTISNTAWTSGGGMTGGPYKSGTTLANSQSLANPTGGTPTIVGTCAAGNTSPTIIKN